MSSSCLTAPPELPSPATSGKLVLARTRQPALGDDEDAETRLAEVKEKVAYKLSMLGDVGITKPKQVLDFMEDVTFKKVGGQQLTCKCMFCGTFIQSTGATRIVDHLSSACVLCPTSVKAPCVAMRATTESKRKGKDEHTALVMVEQDQALRMMKMQKTQLRQEGIKAGFKSAESACADQAIARFFYSNGLNFGAADVLPDSYYREMVRAIQATPPGYMPPNAQKLAGSLLDEAAATMKGDLAARDKEGELSRKFGVTYTSDGWDSCDNLPLINSAYIMANDGGVYQRSVDTSGYSKTAEYCASLMIADIYDIGCTKVVLITTDTCAVMRKCWAIVQDEFPWISIAPCQTHCPSLLVGDIAKLPAPAQTIKDETLVVAWFTNHHKPLSILRNKVQQVFGKSKELKKAGATRMGTNTWVG